MILSDRDIRMAMAGRPNNHDKPLIIDPIPADDCFQPASVDLTLGCEMSFPKGEGIIGFDEYHPIYLRTGHFALFSTAEKVTIPDWLVGQVDGRSTWARKGLQVHCTAGYIDPGFSGQITLELVNHGDELALIPGIKIAQLILMKLTSPAQRPYGHPGLNSHYQGQSGPTLAHG
jgi:dCTP deaminase